MLTTALPRLLSVAEPSVLVPCLTRTLPVGRWLAAATVTFIFATLVWWNGVVAGLALVVEAFFVTLTVVTFAGAEVVHVTGIGPAPVVGTRVNDDGIIRSFVPAAGALYAPLVPAAGRSCAPLAPATGGPDSAMSVTGIA